MALGNSSHSIYLTIVDGKIARRHKQAIQGVAKTRKTQTGNEVHEELFDHVSGFINDIRINPPKVGFEKFGHTLSISIIDGSESYILQTQRDGGYAVAFFKMMLNIDFSLRTSIIPSMKMEGEKKKVTMFINQGGGKAIKHAFTKDNPGELPPLNKVMLRGEEQWDNFEQMKFFSNLLEKTILPRVQKSASNLPAQLQDKPADAISDVKQTVKNASDIEYEDLPF